MQKATYFILSLQRSKRLWTYEDIRLSTYLYIAKTNDLKLLIKKGIFTASQLSTAWEKLVEQNSKNTGNNSHSIYFNQIQGYYKLLNKHYRIKTALMSLAIKVDYDMVAYLNKEGYSIKISNQYEYEKSITNSLNKSKNLITKLESKKAEIDRLKGKGDGKSSTLGEILSDLSYHLGYQVDKNLTLSEYNEYKKIIKKANERNKKAGYSQR